MQDNYFKTILMLEDYMHMGSKWPKGDIVHGVNKEIAEELIKAGSAMYKNGEEPHLKDIRAKKDDKSEEE